MRREWRRCSEVRSSRRCSAGRARSPPSLATALRGLPAGIMRGPELRLVLLALVLCQAPLGPAAPVSVGGGTVLAKMYPRGNHWAVGHLMGKKSTGESRHVLEGDGLKELLRDDIQWEEATRNLLGLIEAKGNSSHRSPQLKPLSTHQPTLDTEDSSNLKDLVDYLLQGLKAKEGALS